MGLWPTKVVYRKRYKSTSSVQLSHSVVSNSANPWTAASQASLPITNSRRLLKLMSIESMMPSNHLILCHPHKGTNVHRKKCVNFMKRYQGNNDIFLLNKLASLKYTFNNHWRMSKMYVYMWYISWNVVYMIKA